MEEQEGEEEEEESGSVTLTLFVFSCPPNQLASARAPSLASVSVLRAKSAKKKNIKKQEVTQSNTKQKLSHPSPPPSFLMRANASMRQCSGAN